MSSLKALILHTLRTIAPLTLLLLLLADVPHSTTAITIDNHVPFECEGEEPNIPKPAAADCRYIISHLPSNLTAATRMPSHYLFPLSPYHPAGHFRYRSCLVVVDLSQDHATRISGERVVRAPSVSPMLREHDAFTVWGAARIALEEIIRECVELEPDGGGGSMELDAWREFDGQMLLQVYGDDGDEGEAAVMGEGALGVDEAPAHDDLFLPPEYGMTNLYYLDG